MSEYTRFSHRHVAHIKYHSHGSREAFVLMSKVTSEIYTGLKIPSKRDDRNYSIQVYIFSRKTSVKQIPTRNSDTALRPNLFTQS